MSKPSIFSKDYEKLMRKRKRKFVTAIIALVIIGAFVVTKAMNYDYHNLRDRLQQWVDGTNTSESKQEQSEDSNNTPNIDDSEQIATSDESEEEPVEEEKEEEKYIEVEIAGNKISFVIETEESTSNESKTDNNEEEKNTDSDESKNEEDNTKLVEVKEASKDYTIAISDTGKIATVLDKDQNLYLVNSKGEVSDLTLAQYVAPDGEIFKKDDVIATYEGYNWLVTPVILSDEKIAYITNIPYFGNDLDDYICIIDIENKTHNTIWNNNDKSITFGEITEKGLQVTIGTSVKYINSNGELIS